MEQISVSDYIVVNFTSGDIDDTVFAEIEGILESVVVVVDVTSSQLADCGVSGGLISQKTTSGGRGVASGKAIARGPRRLACVLLPGLAVFLSIVPINIVHLDARVGPGQASLAR